MPYRVPAPMPAPRSRVSGLWKALFVTLAVLVGLPVLCMAGLVALMVVSDWRVAAPVRTFCAEAPPVGAAVDVRRLEARARELDIQFWHAVTQQGREEQVHGSTRNVLPAHVCRITIVDGRVEHKDEYVYD